MKTFHLQQNLDITNLYVSNLYITNLGITNVFFTTVILKYMKKNLDITKPRYSEHIDLPVPWPFVISRFHYTYNSWVQTVHNKKIISSRKSWNSKQKDIQIRSRSNIKIFRRTVFYPSTSLTLYLAKADTAILFSSLSCLICSFKYLEK